MCSSSSISRCFFKPYFSFNSNRPCMHAHRQWLSPVYSSKSVQFVICPVLECSSRPSKTPPSGSGNFNPISFGSSQWIRHCHKGQPHCRQDSAPGTPVETPRVYDEFRGFMRVSTGLPRVFCRNCPCSTKLQDPSKRRQNVTAGPHWSPIPFELIGS